MCSHVNNQTYLALSYPAGHEFQQPHCRICYGTNRPLVTICQCSGSIEYVHEECIIEWITKKIEMSELLEIPKCQICQHQYEAELHIGKRKICPDLFLEKIKQMPKIQMVYGVVYAIGALVALWTLFNIFIGQLILLTDLFTPGYSFELEELAGIQVLFRDFVFPIIFLNSCRKYCKNMRYVWDDSYVQMVQLILTPRVILKI